MRTALSAITLAALLVLAGCTGGPGTGTTTTPETTTATDAGTTGLTETQTTTTAVETTPGTTPETVVEQDQTMACTDGSGSSPDAFPAASAIDESVLDRHESLLTNTSFTVAFEKTDKRPSVVDPGNFSYFNSTTRNLVEPGASQYLAQPNGTSDFLGTGDLQSVYSNGSSAWALSREDNESTVSPTTHPVFDESSEGYLWRGWTGEYSWGMYMWASENITYERGGVQTFRGTEVMCYEATGVDALPEQFGPVTEFSSTLLIDADGVVRYNRLEANQTAGDEFTHFTGVHTVSDVGSTDVETPDWVPNASAGA